jgi:hypothetical protein
MRTSILVAAALAASVGTAWGQTDHMDRMNGFVVPSPAAIGCQCASTVGGKCVALSCPDHPVTFNAREPVHGPLCYPDTSCPGRAYTLDEIDRMRAAVGKVVPPPPIQYLSVNGMCDIGCQATQIELAERRAVIEDELRTYMAAGISPEALEAKAKETK